MNGPMKFLDTLYYEFGVFFQTFILPSFRFFQLSNFQILAFSILGFFSPSFSIIFTNILYYTFLHIFLKHGLVQKLRLWIAQLSFLKILKRITDGWYI